MKAKFESFTKSKSGKSLRVKLGDAWYGANLDSGFDKLHPGTMVEAAVDDGDFGLWITKWATVGEPATQTAPGQPATNGGDRWYMPFVSNTVAHAISSGQITEPMQIKAWAAAAKQAASEL